MTPEAVLFDLDGTLADTAPDLERALNRLRAEEGLEPVEKGHLRPWVSMGASAMVLQGMPSSDEALFLKRKQRFLDLYTQDPAEHSCLFDHVPALLEWLDQQHIPWGIVTNKPTRMTHPVLAFLELNKADLVVVCGDSLSVAKPHPEPLLHACKHMKVNPEQCIYIGDGERDIQAGQRAGMRTISVAYGYIPPDENPLNWQADIHLNTSLCLLEWFQQSKFLS